MVGIISTFFFVVLLIFVLLGKSNFNIPNVLGRIPLDLVIKNEDTECLIYLLENGAQIPNRDNGLVAFLSKKIAEKRRDAQVTNTLHLHPPSAPLLAQC